MGEKIVKTSDESLIVNMLVGGYVLLSGYILFQVLTYLLLMYSELVLLDKLSLLSISLLAALAVYALFGVVLIALKNINFLFLAGIGLVFVLAFSLKIYFAIGEYDSLEPLNLIYFVDSVSTFVIAASMLRMLSFCLAKYRRLGN